MTAEGNIADTGILKEMQQMIERGDAKNPEEALKMIEKQAKKEQNTKKLQKIKSTEKALDFRHSRKKKDKKRR